MEPESRYKKPVCRRWQQFCLGRPAESNTHNSRFGHACFRIYGRTDEVRKLVRGLLVVFFALTGTIAFAQEQAVPPAPKQPIEFSHKLHVSELKQQCAVCHP